jgi:hypothetical protein
MKRLLNYQAQDLANTSLQDMQSGLGLYTTEEDLSILRIAYIIVRRRKEVTKCKVLASKIRKLDAALHGDGATAGKPKMAYIVIRCAMCRNQVGQGKGKIAAISNARLQRAHIVPIIRGGERKSTIICDPCFQKNPTVEAFGIVVESNHASARSS